MIISRADVQGSKRTPVSLFVVQNHVQCSVLQVLWRGDLARRNAFFGAVGCNMRRRRKVTQKIGCNACEVVVVNSRHKGEGEGAMHVVWCDVA